MKVDDCGPDAKADELECIVEAAAERARKLNHAAPVYELLLFGVMEKLAGCCKPCRAQMLNTVASWCRAKDDHEAVLLAEEAAENKPMMH